MQGLVRVVFVAFLAMGVVASDLVAGELVASETATITFCEADKVSIGPPGPSQYSLGPLDQSGKLRSESYLIELGDDEQASAVVATPLDQSNVGCAPGSFSLLDDVTSENGSYGFLKEQAAQFPALGSRVAHVAGEIVIGDTRYAELLLFPVTADEHGALTLNESVSISVGEREIAPNELLPRESVFAREADGKSTSRTAVLSGGTDYVIITAANLVAAVTPLANYKNETGFVTEIKTIEDILATYSGRDDAERLREYLKDFHADGGKYVLLAGDETVLPIRYAYYMYTNGTPPPASLQICDLYFADLTGDWDVDNDGVWGERYHDQADIVPEINVGRIPFNTAAEISSYTSKLIQYETAPGGSNHSYLTRSFFFSSDQMRDYNGIGQHTMIARAYPDWFALDTVTGVEASRGDDPFPTNTPARNLPPEFEQGYGIVNVIAHGRSDGFVVKSANFNEWPKSYLLSTDAGSEHGCFDSLAVAGQPSFYYSLACDNGAFDMDQEPFNQENPNMVQSLLSQEGGAVGFVAYSRWGWISSSHELQALFFDSLFAHPELPAVEAMYASKLEKYYLLDLVYGQNYYGDPTMKVYRNIPDDLEISTSQTSEGVSLLVSIEGSPVPNCTATLAQDGNLLAQYVTGSDGRVLIDYAFESQSEYTLSASLTGTTVQQEKLVTGIVASVEDDPSGLPSSFALNQNYPNPFNPTTTISFEIPVRTSVQLTVFNLLGQSVATLAEGDYAVGTHEVEWDGHDRAGDPAASGVYFYRLEAGGQSEVRKMILLK